MIILLDAMGGDNAPDATIKGAVKAIKDIKAEVWLIGNEKIINEKVYKFYSALAKDYNNKPLPFLIFAIISLKKKYCYV